MLFMKLGVFIITDKTKTSGGGGRRLEVTVSLL